MLFLKFHSPDKAFAALSDCFSRSVDPYRVVMDWTLDSKGRIRHIDPAWAERGAFVIRQRERGVSLIFNGAWMEEGYLMVHARLFDTIVTSFDQYYETVRFAPLRYAGSPEDKL